MGKTVIAALHRRSHLQSTRRVKYKSSCCGRIFESTETNIRIFKTELYPASCVYPPIKTGPPFDQKENKNGAHQGHVGVRYHKFTMTRHEQANGLCKWWATVGDTWHNLLGTVWTSHRHLVWARQSMRKEIGNFLSCIWALYLNSSLGLLQWLIESILSHSYVLFICIIFLFMSRSPVTRSHITRFV